MSPGGCRIAVLVLVLAGWAWLPSTSASSSAPPPFCEKRSNNTPVQVPVEVKLCVAGKFQAKLSFQDEDTNVMAYLDIMETKGLLMEGRMRRDQQPKASGRVPRAALQDGCLHLKIKLDHHTELQFFSHDDSPLLTLPVSKTASVRVKVEQPQTFETCSQNSATKTNVLEMPQHRNYSSTGPTDQTATEEVILLSVEAGLVCVAVVLSLVMLVLTATLG